MDPHVSFIVNVTFIQKKKKTCLLSIAVGLSHYSLYVFHRSFGSLTLPSSHSAGRLSRPRLAGLHSVPPHGWRHGPVSKFVTQPVLSACLCIHLASKNTCLCEYNTMKVQLQYSVFQTTIAGTKI